MCASGVVLDEKSEGTGKMSSCSSCAFCKHNFQSGQIVKIFSDDACTCEDHAKLYMQQCKENGSRGVILKRTVRVIGGKALWFPSIKA